MPGPRAQKRTVPEGATHLILDYKGSNRAAADPISGKAVFLFDPRTQQWDDHFQINPDAALSGRTPEGRVTIDVLKMNDEPRVQYRQFAMSIGEYPCRKDE